MVGIEADEQSSLPHFVYLERLEWPEAKGKAPA